MSTTRQCLVWLPHSYIGRGPAESCVRIIEHFAAAGIEPTLFVNRARAPVADTIRLTESAVGIMRKAPYRVIADAATWRLARLFKDAVSRAEPGTIAYFWPDTAAELVEYARKHGLICVREMINSPLQHAKPILDDAYVKVGLIPSHGITSPMVAAENKELALYDFVFSSNAEVDRALRLAGIDEDRILKASFGWVKDRFTQGAPSSGSPDRAFKAVFVGLMNVRKGVPTLLEAWEKTGIDGELLLAGTIEDCLQPLVARHCKRHNVRHLGHVSDVASLYRSCDAFVFPTFEEGGPQVTYEAAACGVPVITTPMGAARLVKDRVSGLIRPAGDADAFAEALCQLASEKDLGRSLAKVAADKVDKFEYQNVAETRVNLLRSATASL